MTGNQSRQLEQAKTRLSLAISVQDELTADRRPIGSIQVTVKEVKAKATKNISGFYLFTNLQDAAYHIVITSEFYLHEEREVVIDSLSGKAPMVVDVKLKPNSTYPFSSNLPILRAIVRNQEGTAVQGADVQGKLLQPQLAVKAKVDGPASTEDTMIRLKSLQGNLNIGDILMIKDPNSQQTEFIKINTPLPKNQSEPYYLSSPLQYKHAENTAVYLMEEWLILDTKTTEKGEWVLCFPQLKEFKMLCRVMMSAEGYHPISHDAEITEGDMTYMGVIQLSPL